MTDPIQPAQKIAAMTVAAFVNNQKTYWNQKVKGVPARPAVGGQPPIAAITAEEYLTALGAGNVEALDAAYGQPPA